MVKKNFCDIVIVDFNSDETIDSIIQSLIERKIEYNVVNYQDILSYLSLHSVKGIILSGSLCHVYDKDAPKLKKEILEMGIPILGICYGMQVIADALGCQVVLAENEEHNKTEIEFFPCQLVEGLGNKNIVSMLHEDRVTEIPFGYTLSAKTKDCPIAGFFNQQKKIYAVQFHPELGCCGELVLNNFFYNICGVQNEHFS